MTSRKTGSKSAARERSRSLRDNKAEEAKLQLSRREIIKRSAGAAVATSLIGVDSAVAAGISEASQAKSPKLLFFTPDEFALVDELTELIIPSDDHSPGARAAEVAPYIDFRLSESLDEEPKTTWREGLKLIEKISSEMNGKAFLQSTREQRIALLTRIAANEKKPEKPEEKFFVELKAKTIGAYYTSKIGIHNEMEYKGNTYLKEYVGYDAT